jgi:uncharacterized protein
MAPRRGDLMIAHDCKHVERVRKWALVIAEGEGLAELEVVEVTALLHDIGLARMDDGEERRGHGPLGADAIRHHSRSPCYVADHLNTLGGKGKLLEVIRDADNLDALGAVGLMRAFSSKHFLPEYDPSNIKGDAWGLSSAVYRERFADKLSPVNTIIDQVNQQVRYYDNFHTMTGRNLAVPLVRFMKDFVLQLETEVGPKG